MDARKFASKYVKPDNVRDEPIETRIINVVEDERYGRLMLELETGSQFALNDGNTNTLIKAWGNETDAWIGQELALELGHYTDRREGIEKETVKVRAISPTIPPTKPAQNGGASETKKPVLPPIRTSAMSGGDMEDEIPF